MKWEIERAKLSGWSWEEKLGKRVESEWEKATYFEGVRGERQGVREWGVHLALVIWKRG